MPTLFDEAAEADQPRSAGPFYFALKLAGQKTNGREVVLMVVFAAFFLFFDPYTNSYYCTILSKHNPFRRAFRMLFLNERF